MKNWTKIFLIAAFLLPLSALADGDIYKVLWLKGNAHFIREGKKRDVLKGDMLIKGDSIQTSNESVVILGFDEDFKSKIKVSPNSQLELAGTVRVKIDGTFKNNTVLNNKLGSVLVDWLNKDKEKNRLEIKTKTAAMGVRGTRFLTHVELDGRVAVAVYEGLVMARHNSGGEGFALSRKQGAIFFPDGRSEKLENEAWMKEINWSVDQNSGEEGLYHQKNFLNYLREGLNSSTGSKRGFNKTPLILNISQRKKEKECLEGKASVCTELGIELLRNGDSGDSITVRDLFKKGCDLKDARACVWTGRVEYEFGDKGVGKKVVSDMCDSKIGYACYTMWELTKTEGNKDADKYYRKSVEILHNLSDLDGALNDYQAGCEMKNSGACMNMAILMENLNRPDDAKKFYHQACDQNDGEACSNLGYLAQQAGQVTQARDLYQKSCLGSTAIGCYNLACLYSTQGKKDLSIQYLRMAVTNGYFDYAHASQDSDLKSIQDHPEYKVIMELMKVKGRN